MLQWHSDHPWDTLRLVDFGFAKHYETGQFSYRSSCLESRLDDAFFHAHSKAAAQTSLCSQEKVAMHIDTLPL
jgi:predicted molibdopterin-dependent oxidoreductase YjgC